MKWPWKRASNSDEHFDALLKEARLASRPSEPFRMTVVDVFVIARRGTVATGRIESGSVTVGQQVRVVRAGLDLGTTAVTGVEMFRKKLDTASAGDNVGLLMTDDLGESVMSGDVLEA